MGPPVVLIPHAPGTNRDGDAAHAVQLAGGRAEIVTLHELRVDRSPFHRADVILLPGGFSYGDALGAGLRWALDLQLFFEAELREVVAAGKRVLGICNGFQVLVKAGLLPGAVPPRATRDVTLTRNASGQFECRWVHLKINRDSPAGYLRIIESLIFCPVAHGEGNFQVRHQDALEHIEMTNLVAFRYVDGRGAAANGRYPINPNGSIADIAGITNGKGNVLGLMPHPENHILPVQNPLGPNGGRLGLALFEAVLHG